MDKSPFAAATLVDPTVAIPLSVVVDSVSTANVERTKKFALMPVASTVTAVPPKTLATATYPC